ncbi:MAG: YggS family pyridoxal phosphate-dependent enzyme [Alphaproteobacteria bacterium]|nr:YggS family pyridoxal phosphate-dependent enzyme [Alphaproteobacteria bacterium]
MDNWKNLKRECELGNTQLMAVSKGQGIEKILPLLKVGQTLFGENRVQEAEDKWPSLKENYPNIAVHLIGPLQTNKVKQALGLFNCIQSVDNQRLADKLKQEMSRMNLNTPLMIQLNLGNEPQKRGVSLSDADDFINYCKHELKLSIIGLMGIPPLEKDPVPYFRNLIALADQHNLPQRSMGMSLDYDKAIKCGSTLIRIGAALFGPR